MKLINEIINILGNENPNLENALMKTKILLHKMEQKPLLSWVNNELNGYSETAQIPEYRVVQTMIYGDIASSSYRHTHTQLPIMHLEEKIQQGLSSIKLTESISSLENIAQSNDIIAYPINPESYSIFNKGLQNGFYTEKAYYYLTKMQTLEVITQIRSRLLDFILELSDKIPESLNDEEVILKSKEINIPELLTNAIFGDNATIIIGNNNTHNKYSLKNDFNSLFQALKTYEISFDEMEELKKSIEIDNESLDSEKKEYGTQVKGWIQKISSKVTDKIAVENIMEQLERFYGWLS